MRHLTIEPGEKKPIAYCECCKKLLYKGDKVFRNGAYHYCSLECLLKDLCIHAITLGE